MIVITLFLGVGVLCGCLIYKYKKLKQEKGHLVQGHEDHNLRLTGGHLDTLHAQLNPHLLKNVLNSILSHAYQTYYTMDKLSYVLDYVLYESPNKLVTPKEEIDFAINLIEINKIKVSPLLDLRVKVNVIVTKEPLYGQKVLAPLISVDLIENAFKHSDLQSANAFISIVFEFKNGCFLLNVSNKISNKIPLKKLRSGVGSRTLEERLQLLYKDYYSLQRFVEGDVFIAQLKINLDGHRVKMHST
ncbi:histidine kinase [Sphingobacterium sp. Ka21]|uniref:Histidine kinase n=2 Tax=Sphingobacterium pedocola TaxID=2082722 RepID=A0ABR9T4X9_9SPHI|nr:histidine kinase [Sphingobacterium pedocola]